MQLFYWRACAKYSGQMKLFAITDTVDAAREVLVNALKEDQSASHLVIEAALHSLAGDPDIILPVDEPHAVVDYDEF